jgi:hypothetical protein
MEYVMFNSTMWIQAFFDCPEVIAGVGDACIFLVWLSSKTECIYLIVGGAYPQRGVDGCLRAFSAR